MAGASDGRTGQLRLLKLKLRSEDGATDVGSLLMMRVPRPGVEATEVAEAAGAASPDAPSSGGSHRSAPLSGLPDSPALGVSPHATTPRTKRAISAHLESEVAISARAASGGADIAAPLVQIVDGLVNGSICAQENAAARISRLRLDAAAYAALVRAGALLVLRQLLAVASPQGRAAAEAALAHLQCYEAEQLRGVDGMPICGSNPRRAHHNAVWMKLPLRRSGPACRHSFLGAAGWRATRCHAGRAAAAPLAVRGPRPPPAGLAVCTARRRAARHLLLWHSGHRPAGCL